MKNQQKSTNGETLKKLFLLISVFLSITVNAQKFYSSSEVEIGWKFWDNESGWNFLINNGKKLTISCLPTITSSRVNLANPTEICAFILLNKKFILITFSESEGIKLRTSNSAITFLSMYNPMSYVSSRPWYDIDFENIVYDPIFNQIMIPCGIDDTGNFNAICINFIASSSNPISMSENEFNESKVKYYDLQGREVKKNESSKGRILIKTDGKKSVKIINK